MIVTYDRQNIFIVQATGQQVFSFIVHNQTRSWSNSSKFCLANFCPLWQEM